MPFVTVGRENSGEIRLRQRRTADSREPLRSAAAIFEALGCAPWAVRTSQELRAAGQSGPDSVKRTGRLLSPRELEIARLAASGLTNRQIAQQLYLSHRTVASHLYRAFPKLGVSSRAQISGALTVC